MALDLRPKKPVKGKVQSWVVRFQINTGKRNKNGRIIYRNFTKTIGHKGELNKDQRDELHEYWRQYAKGGPLIVSPKFMHFAPEYLRHKKEVEKKRSWNRDAYSIRNLLKFFGPEKKLSEFTPKDFDNYKAARLKEGAKPATINRELECARNMFNQAEIWDQFEGKNPVSISGTLQEIREEIVPMNYEEEDMLLPELGECHARVIEFDINTGMRISEVIGLKTPMIDFKRCIAKLEATDVKGKYAREVPLNDTAINIINEALAYRKKMKSKSDHIFLNSKGGRFKYRSSIYMALQRACKRAGLRPITPHVIRHTFITRAIESGEVGPIEVQEVVGQTSIKILMRYTHLKEAKRKVVTSIERKKKPSLKSKKIK